MVEVSLTEPFIETPHEPQIQIYFVSGPTNCCEGISMKTWFKTHIELTTLASVRPVINNSVMVMLPNHPIGIDHWFVRLVKYAFICRRPLTSKTTVLSAFCTYKKM